MHTVLRRRKLGRTSVREIARLSTTGIQAARNDQPFTLASGEYLFRWGCTSNVPEGAQVVNSAESIHWCTDKRAGRLAMQEAGVSVPITWGVENFNGVSMVDQFVLRPAQHAQGRHLITGHSEDIRRAIARDERYRGGYVSSLVYKVAEYRVAIVQGRVAWAARKTPGNPDQVAWNVAQGGRFDNVRWDDWPLRVIEQALHAARVSGTDFCGVDVMVDSNGNPFVLEVNSAPSLTSPYRQQCFARCFDFIVSRGKEHFDAVVFRPRTTYKSCIHPAIRQNANA